MPELTTDGCCGNLIVGWKRPAQDPFMRTVVASSPPPLPPPPSAPPTPAPTAAAPAAAAPAPGDLPWTAFVTPAAHLPNFRYTPEGRARFSAREWAVVESFVRWVSDCEGGVPSAREWTPNVEPGADGRESGIVSFLRGLNVAPCLAYLLQRSLDDSADEDAAVRPLPALTIDVGAFAIEVVAGGGAVSSVSLVHESGSRTTVPVDGVERLVCPHARLLDTVEEGVTR